MQIDGAAASETLSDTGGVSSAAHPWTNLSYLPS